MYYGPDYRGDVPESGRGLRRGTVERVKKEEEGRKRKREGRGKEGRREEEEGKIEDVKRSKM